MSLSPFAVQRAHEDITRHVPPLMMPRFAKCGVFALILILFATACAPSRPIRPVQPPSTTAARSTDFDAEQHSRLVRLRAALAEPMPDGLAIGLSVRVAFDDVADLDLFVTDPMQESVYFANSPTRSGGRLIEDRRCLDPAPRVETVHFPNPIRGRYRVGVDFHRRCEDTSASGAARNEGVYVVRVDEGERVLERSGMIVPGQFEVIVIEFDVD
jgi:hypothetical protein